MLYQGGTMMTRTALAYDEEQAQDQFSTDEWLDADELEYVRRR